MATDDFFFFFEHNLCGWETPSYNKMEYNELESQQLCDIFKKPNSNILYQKPNVKLLLNEKLCLFFSLILLLL